MGWPKHSYRSSGRQAQGEIVLSCLPPHLWPLGPWPPEAATSYLPLGPEDDWCPNFCHQPPSFPTLCSIYAPPWLRLCPKVPKSSFPAPTPLPKAPLPDSLSTRPWFSPPLFHRAHSHTHVSCTPPATRASSCVVFIQALLSSRFLLPPPRPLYFTGY